MGYSLFRFLNPVNIQELSLNFNLTYSPDPSSLKNFVNLKVLSIKIDYYANSLPILFSLTKLTDLTIECQSPLLGHYLN